MIRDLARLFRLRLSLMNGVAALAGCLLAPEPVVTGIMASAFAGVTLLAMGGSALNQVLERDLDLQMQRTMDRPLPRRTMGVGQAVLAGLMAIVCGSMLLAAGNPLAPLLGLAALAWYLGVYTPLKCRTPLALPVGALSGAMPPVIGWVLAGGTPADFRILLLAGLFYLWQVPHFWLFQQRHADDYRRAGIPLFRLHPGQFGLWVAALAAAALLLPLFGVAGRHSLPCLALLLLPLAASWFCRSERLRSVCLNLVPLVITLVLALPR